MQNPRELREKGVELHQSEEMIKTRLRQYKAITKELHKHMTYDERVKAGYIVK